MCEFTYNYIQCKNRVSTMTFRFRICSVLQFLAKPWVLVLFVLYGFVFLPISKTKNKLKVLYSAKLLWFSFHKLDT